MLPIPHIPLTRVAVPYSVLATMLAAGAVTVAQPPTAGPAVAKPSAFAALPIAFESNVGQVDPKVRFLAHAPGSTVYLTGSKVVLALHRRGQADDVISMQFGAAGATPHAAAIQPLAGVSNYLRGSDPSKWRTHVAQFAAVRYDNVYPGIGLDFHGAADAGLEYDVRVNAGADPSVVALTMSGARSLAIAPNGDLVLRLRDRQIRQLRPVAWQSVNGKRHHVSVRYSLRGSTVGFRLGAYDRSRPLLIDPKVAYASFLGGSGAEGCGPAPGRDGSLYVVCGTDSTDLPEVGAIQPPGAAPEDVYVAKIDPSGRHLVYATYLGAAGNDEGDAIAVDASGHVYISGFAGDGFPTTAHAYDPTSNGGTGCCDDGFVAKLSTDGSRLLYSTFLGGSGAEGAGALALGRDGSVVVTGSTSSADFPTTSGAVSRVFHGGTATYGEVPADSFATKLDPTGSKLVYSTYLGGSGDDVGLSVAVDDAGSAYLTGFTESAEFPTTSGALKTSLVQGTLLNGYVTKLGRSGRLAWSTYLGGTGRDSAWGIDLDSHRNVYVSGSSIGGFPVTAGAAQTTFGGDRDWFVAKLDRSGASLDWATYLGGSGYDGLAPALRVDRHGNADVEGATASTDFPTTPDAFQGANAGAFDMGVVQLDRRGRLQFSSYFGGSGDEDNTGSRPGLDSSGNFYISGVTSSTDLPVTSNAVQPAYGGGDIDGLIAKVDFGHHR